jgi:hypothetical protein
MNKIVFILLLLSTLSVFAQDKYTVSGTITDERGEPLIGAAIYETSSMQGVVTNAYGFYSLTLPNGDYELASSYLGYQQTHFAVDLSKDKKLNIKLIPESTDIEAVEVRASGKKAHVDKIEMSTEKLPIKTIKKLPVLMGETDIIKTIQLLPGVQTVGEGTSGFYVRGGAVDQNLILLDEATVYNPSHIGGFFSVFNGDAVKNVELYKGGISSRYGGRMSSVLDVRMKEGSTDKFHANGGIGLISSRLTMEGPLYNDKLSFIASGRRTYLDLLFPLMSDPVVKNSKAFFHDFNTKLSWRLNENNRIYFSGYFGRDVMGFGDMFEMSYGNTTGTVRWNHMFSDKLFLNTTLIYSDFDYYLGQPEGAFAFNWYADVIDIAGKADFSYYMNPSNTLRFGVHVTQHTTKPGHTESNDTTSNFNIPDIPNNYAMEHNYYLENKHKFNDWLMVQYGLRFSVFHNTGGTIYNLDENLNATDSIVYKRGEAFNTFTGIEPRIGVRMKLDYNSSLKINYNRIYQFMHLATNTAATTPVDVWFMSNPNIDPQYADQVAAGYFRNFLDDQIEISTEVYYKKMYNTIDFKDHAELIANPRLDAELRFGEGYSYGLEFMAKKQEGKFTGWISYTYSKTRRKIDGVNGGKEYPSPYDKPHDIKVVATYEAWDRFTFGATWVYSSPMPMTIAEGWAQVENQLVPIYSARNSKRLKGTEYHRLDLSATMDFKQRKNFEHSLSLSIYNAYNRANMYSILYDYNKQDATIAPSMMKMYLFKILPTLTYNFKF